MKIETTAQVYLMGRHVRAGEVLDVPPAIAQVAINCGRAKVAKEDAAAPAESQPPIETETRESALPPRRRR